MALWLTNVTGQAGFTGRLAEVVEDGQTATGLSAGSVGNHAIEPDSHFGPMLFRGEGAGWNDGLTVHFGGLSDHETATPGAINCVAELAELEQDIVDTIWRHP